MSQVKYLKKQDQQIEPLFNGAFTENKPIGFPTRQGSTAYSNLFYWAHLVAHETAEFPLHPHEGFEIMTFVLKGTVEHYDTATKVYTPLNAGDVQAIQAGSGVSHSERITKGSELFQIWFDPDFSKSLSKDATYKDYQKNSFSTQKKENGVSEIVYVGNSGKIIHDTLGLEVKKISFKSSSTTQNLDEKSTYSYYLIDGEMDIDGQTLQKDDFLVLNNAKSVTYKVANSAELFLIKTPSNVPYIKFIDRY